MGHWWFNRLFYHPWSILQHPLNFWIILNFRWIFSYIKCAAGASPWHLGNNFLHFIFLNVSDLIIDGGICWRFRGTGKGFPEGKYLFFEMLRVLIIEHDLFKRLRNKFLFWIFRWWGVNDEKNADGRGVGKEEDGWTVMVHERKKKVKLEEDNFWRWSQSAESITQRRNQTEEIQGLPLWGPKGRTGRLGPYGTQPEFEQFLAKEKLIMQLKIWITFCFYHTFEQ